MTSEAVTIIVRDILQHNKHHGTKTFTAHSMKTTFLSWCGKAGIGKPYRLTLGAHSQGPHNMADLYSRDELAEPLRQLGYVLARVMQRGFMPDSTKSGRFPAPHHKEEKQDNCTSAPRLISKDYAGQTNNYPTSRTQNWKTKSKRSKETRWMKKKPTQTSK